MDSVLKDLSVRAMALAIEANLFVYFRYLSGSASVELYDRPDMTGFITGIRHSFMNGIFRTPPTPGDTVEEALTYLKSRKVPFMWWLGSAAQSADWARLLEAQGLVYGEDFSGMAADLLALNEDWASPPDLSIEPVGDREALEQFVDVALVGFGIPRDNKSTCFDMFAGLGFHLPLRNYVGLLAGKPVAASQLFLGAGVAGIYWVATLPEARRQGIATALTLAPLREARAMGCRIGILHPSDKGRGVYRRLGFEEYCKLSYGRWRVPSTNEMGGAA